MIARSVFEKQVIAPLPASNRLNQILSRTCSENNSTCAPPGGKWMKASSVKSFSKKLACPSSNLLLSFRRQALAKEVNFLIRHHLETCDFCFCELPLLAYYTPPRKGEIRTPELPINLRLLVEAIFRERLGSVSEPQGMAECSEEAV